jgi:hypothetical protein
MIPENFPQSYLDALTEINNNHGRGKIVGIECCDSGDDGTVTCELQFGTCKATYTVKGNTLYFRGHQRKIIQNR